MGTLIGLINVLNHMGDASQIGYGMNFSLLTNFLFTPLVGKLAAHIQRETWIMNIVIEVVLAICDQCVPIEISHKLLTRVEADMTSQATGPSASQGIWQKWSSTLRQSGPVR